MNLAAIGAVAAAITAAIGDIVAFVDVIVISTVGSTFVAVGIGIANAAAVDIVIAAIDMA